MGTRHQQIVIAKDGTRKISQYGQWDGYPSGQGVEILNYLTNGDLEKYHDELIKIPVITDEQCKQVEQDKNWPAEYPYLSRDCGSKIHQMIEDGKVKFVSLVDDEEAKKWCEGFYTIDFSQNEFTSEYGGVKMSFSLNALPSKEEYLKIM